MKRQAGERRTTTMPSTELKPLCAALAAALAALPAMLYAEEAPMLSDVVVSAPAPEDEAGAISVTEESKDALRAATSDTASLLRAVPGVNLYTSGGVSSLPSIHGLADDRLRTKVDGMDLISACGNHMNPPLSYIDPTHVDSAQVYTSLVPVSVGGDSIGGAIVVDSPEPEFAAPGAGTLTNGEAGVFYRSNGDTYGGNLAATIANEKFSVTYAGATAQADDYTAGGDFKPAGPAAAGRDWLDADEVGSTMYKSTNQSITFAARHENHLLDLKLGIQDIPYQGWPNQRMDMTDNDSTQINLRYRGEYAWGDLEARAYQEKTRHKMQFYDDKLYWYGPNNVPNSDGVPCVTLSGGQNGCAAGMPMDTDAKNTGVVVKAEIPLSSRDLLRVGSELQNYRLDDWWDPSGKGMWPDTFWNIRDGERDRLAVYGEWEAQWTSQWLTQLGLRHETVDMDAGDVQGYSPTYSTADAAAFNAADHSKTDQNLDATALARFTPSAMQSYEFGIAQKTRSPNLYERYTWSTHGMSMRMINWFGDGNGYVGNLDLKPETARTVSITADWHDAGRSQWGLQVTPYYTKVDDYIDAERCSGGMGMGAACTTANLTAEDAFVYLQFVNQDATLYGIDVSGFMPLAKSASLGEFTLNGLLNYVRGENDETGDNLYNMMPLNTTVAVVQRLGGWTGSVEWQWVDDKDRLSWERNEQGTDSYNLFNLRGSYEWKQVRLDVGVENVADKLYFHPLGGAYLGQGKTMSGTDVPWGTTVPGMGRSLYTAVNVKF